MNKIKNFLIKREQSQACLSFAKREKSRLLAKTILTLVALLAVTTGAWAEDLYEEFTTNTGATVYPGEHFKITVDQKGDGDGFTLRPNAYATIEAVNGETITKVEFTKGWYDITRFSCEVGTTTFSGDVATVSGVNQTSLRVNATDPLQIKVVKVYYTEGSSASAFDVDWDAAKKTGSFDMPGGNVELEPEYYPQAALTAEPTAINDVPATTDGAIVNAGTVANIGETTTAQGTVMYYVSTTALDDAALLALDADAWKADVPTAESFTAAGTAYVYYYVRGNDSDTDDEIFSDGDILAKNALTVTIAAAPTYAVTFKAANANTIQAGKATVTVGGKAATVTEGKLEGVKMGSEVKVTAKEGYKFRKVEAKKGIVKLLSITVGAVTIYYAEGENWTDAINRAENKDSGLFIREGNRVHHPDYGQLVDSNTQPVLPDAKINANESYKFVK